MITHEQQLDELKRRLKEVDHLEKANAVLYWDMSTYMPPGGSAARGQVLSTLSQIAHEKFTSAEIGRLLDSLQSYAESLPHEDDDAALIRVTRRNYDKRVKLPTAFVGEVTEHVSNVYQAWMTARPANDWASVREPLKKTLDYSRQMAGYFAPYDHIADPFIDMSDYGMKTADIRRVFAELREELVPLVKAITAQQPAADSVIRRHFPEAAQIAFGEAVIRDMGYDFERGRQDKTAHPFETRINSGDVRILTRVDEHFFGDAFFSTVHEAGHAMYEQGINPAYDGTPLAEGTSMGVHESQSRTWENIVGRSREFWQHYYPRLQQMFPEALGDVTMEAFHRAVNKVVPSLIRVDADEVTYNLHVMIRFDLEVALLEGTLEIDDLPRVWDERYTSDLGITPPDYQSGVMQDVHWFGGTFGGAFQGYTLGNLLSAQFYEAALKAHPTIPAEMARGQFGTLHGWLTENIYQYGSKYIAPELIQRVTGGGIEVAPLMRYLRTKYGALYSL